MQTQVQTEADKQLRDSVASQIEWEPEVTSRDIAVSARDGLITLTGFAHSYFEKLAAEKAAKAIYGVKAVANDIEVRATGSRTDPEIARDILHAFASDVTVPEDKIKVSVKSGYVTLEGKVDWNFQKVGAATCAYRTAGVRGVTNEITITPAVSPSGVKTRIEEALKRNAEVDARRISVSASDGTVFLRGSVRSWFEREEAVRAAWAAPGVTKVEDHIAVVP